MKNIKITPAKYNAYYALSSSATYNVTTPRVLVVPDCEKKMVKTVDWVDENENIVRCDKELTFNLFDGMGLISPAFAEIWANDMGCDYIPSSFVCRASYVKGNLMVFDFQAFAREVASKTVVTDVYGNEVDIERIDVILTQSQFKLWNAYDSWQEYEQKFSESGLSWGVSRVAPKSDKDFTRLNYQFLQVLNMTDDDVAEVCKPTIEWLKGVAGDDINKVLLYLLGKTADSENADVAWSRIQDNYVKCLLMDNRLIGDKYIQNRILKSINKRIKESYMGKIMVHGNYQEIFADGYALCEHIFGMEVRGILKENEHYSAYWNGKGKKRVVAMRSPLTWRSEVNLLNLQDTEEQRKWFKYVKSGIIYNVWGVDNMLQAGSDFDGDGVFTTDNEVFIRCRYGGVPVAYEPKKAPKEYLRRKDLMEVSYLGFNTTIGWITNVATTIEEMLSKYDEGSKEYNELIKRGKLCCFHQSQTIDSAKGIATTPIPNEWTRYTTIKSDMTDEQKAYFSLCNNIIIEDRPYFMRYLYSHYNRGYKTTVADFNRLCVAWFGYKYNELADNKELLTTPEKKAKFEEVSEYYEKKLGILTTNGVMNRICRYMEKELENIKKLVCVRDGIELGDLILGEEYTPDEIKLGKMVELRERYLAFKKSKMLSESPYATYEQYYKSLREEALSTISNNLVELGELAVWVCYKIYPNKTKDFAWDVFGSGIAKCMYAKRETIFIPIQHADGDIEYLGKKYKYDVHEIVKFDWGSYEGISLFEPTQDFVFDWEAIINGDN